MSTVQIVNQPFGLNCSLSYLPWAGLTADLDDAAKQSIKPDCLAQGGSPLNTVQLLPGMTLRITDALLFSPKGSGPGNGFVPSLSDYYWRVPDGRLMRSDFFFLSVLLAAAAPETPGVAQDFVKQFRAFLAQTKADNPDNAYEAICNQILKTLQPGVVIGRSGVLAAAPGTASRVREWLTEPAIEDFEGPSYPQNLNMREFLRFGIPGTTGPDSVVFMHTFQSGGGFYLDDLKAGASIGAGNSWYLTAGINPRRFHFEVQADISLSRELSSRQVPIYYSLADVERDFHVGIFGFQRQGRFFNCVRDSDLNDIDPAAIVSNGVVTIYFGDPPESDPAPAPAMIGLHWPPPSAAALKEQLLVAPGDHYFVNPMLP